MSIEGKLSINLTVEKGRVSKIDILSSRPLKAASVLEDKRIEQTLVLLPRLFSICATAQSTAAVRAAASALNRPSRVNIEAGRDMLVLFETAREHVLRIALDWPRLLNESVEASWAAPLTTLVKDAESALFKEGAFTLEPELTGDTHSIQQLADILASRVFGQDCDDWLDGLNTEKWQAWAEQGDTVAARLVGHVRTSGWSQSGSITPAFLPTLDDVELSQRFNDEFVARPDWQGGVFETTSLARQQSHPLVAALSAEQGSGIETRLAAKLVELASVKAALKELSHKLTMNEQSETGKNGIGQAEAARGRLVHSIELADDSVSSYRILAPTEWNFHPEGAVAQSLATLSEDDEQVMRTQAALLIETIDPCVGYELNISNA